MLTVTLRLKPMIVSAHLVFGMLLAAGLAVLAWRARLARVEAPPLVRRLCLGVFGLLLVQILLGGWVSANSAALACQGFPTCNGGWWPTLRFEQIMYPLAPNHGFVAEVARRFKPGDTLLLMRRSGHRSAPAVNALAEAGFINVYSVIDGFEGDPVADRASPDFGKRIRNGWRNEPLPWTTELDPALVYTPAK